MKIYAISGLGADRTVFQYLRLEAEIIHLEWLVPEKNESINNYAFRMCQKIDTTSPYCIMGLSFGGLIAIEMNQYLNPKLTILISSVETKNEIPTLFRVMGKTNLLKVAPQQLFDLPKGFAHFLFGTKEKEVFDRVLERTDKGFVKWALNELVNWKNETRIEKLLKIHGSKDKVLFPHPDERTIIIEGGEHLMIMDKAKEVSEAINQALSEI